MGRRGAWYCPEEAGAAQRPQHRLQHQRTHSAGDAAQRTCRSCGRRSCRPCARRCAPPLLAARSGAAKNGRVNGMGQWCYQVSRRLQPGLAWQQGLGRARLAANACQLWAGYAAGFVAERSPGCQAAPTLTHQRRHEHAHHRPTLQEPGHFRQERLLAPLAATRRLRLRRHRGACSLHEDAVIAAWGAPHREGGPCQQPAEGGAEAGAGQEGPQRPQRASRAEGATAAHAVSLDQCGGSVFVSRGIDGGPERSLFAPQPNAGHAGLGCEGSADVASFCPQQAPPASDSHWAYCCEEAATQWGEGEHC